MVELALVFVMAAVPWVEILMVIPAGIAYGLSPLGVVAAAFLGNILPVWGLIFAYEKWVAWRRSRSQLNEDNQDGTSLSSFKGKSSSKIARAQRIWERYGLPGLAFMGPMITGIHLAVLIALALKSPRRSTFYWMTASLGLWSVGLGVVSYYGIGWLGF